MRTKVLPVLFVMGALGYALVAYPQEAQPTLVVDEGVATAEAKEPELVTGEPLTVTEEFNRLVTSDPTLMETFAEGKDVTEAIMEMKRAKEAGGTIDLVLIMLLLSSIFKVLLSIAKFIKKEFWKTRQGKTVMKLITLGLGFAVLITTKIGLGMHWGEAILLSLSGPGAMMVHEIIGMFQGMKDPKDAEAAAATADKPPA